MQKPQLREITQAASRNFPPTISSLHDRLEYFSLWLLKYTPWAFLVPRFYLDEGRSLPSHLQRVQEANVKATLTYYEIPGYHSESLLYNNKSVGILGKQLKACLDEAQAKCLRSEL